MTNLEILILLKEIYNTDFLNTFILLKQNSKKYKKSQFYKETKISLSELYKYYYTYVQGQYGLLNQIIDAIRLLDKDMVIEKINDIFSNLEKSGKMQDILNKIFNQFNIQSLLDTSKEFKESLQDLKLSK